MKCGYFKKDITPPAGQYMQGKAYLRVPGGNGVTAKMLHISFGDDADAIVSPLAETDDDAMYNLSGQRIQKIQKGIYIKGGKKILR